ncbi:MAG: hypothetical protein IT373_01035 [Polyangiaceae bacterium]|nr:hypothetical protein [Polyangiaceae bacterium]
MSNARTFLTWATVSFVTCTATATAMGLTKLRRVSAMDCVASTYDERVVNYSEGVILDIDGAGVFCPFNDEYGVFDKSQVANLDVYVYDGDSNSRIRATTCASYATTLGSTCGTYDQTTDADAGGNYVLNPGLGGWSNASYFGYLHVVPYGTTPYQVFKGYKAYD